MRRAPHTDRHRFRPPLAAVLGIDPEDREPVHIILAAQLRLRQYRREAGGSRNRQASREVRRIVAARDTLLRDAVSDLTRRGIGCLPDHSRAFG